MTTEDTATYDAAHSDETLLMSGPPTFEEAAALSEEGLQKAFLAVG